MKILPLPSYEDLHEIFELDETSPSGLRWKKSTCTRIKPGTVAGTKCDKGYWNVYIISRRYKVHRIIFYMRTGIDPKNNLVDHVNRVTSDNSCLRLANFSQNSANREKTLYKKLEAYSRFKGVTWHKKHQKWQGQITVNCKKIHLGYFETEQEAALAYDKVALEAWGSHSKLNFPVEV